MKVRLTSAKPEPAAEARLWEHIPTTPTPMIARGETIVVPDEVGEWLLDRFGGDFELAVDEQAPAPTQDKESKGPGVEK